MGLAGLFDLGYVTNFAVGAYLMGVLTNSGPQATGEFNFWLILPASILAAMFTGLLLALPVIRMRGDYLAIATMGFGEIIRLLALSDWLAPLIRRIAGHPVHSQAEHRCVHLPDAPASLLHHPGSQPCDAGGDSTVWTFR